MQYRIGTSYETLTALDALATPVIQPDYEFEDYADEIALGDTGTRGVGLPVARWVFGLLDDVDQRDQLKSFCAGLSATVYITTQRNDGAYVDYQAVMHWPRKEKHFTEQNPADLIIEFTGLVEISGSGS
jgi:hypothetical protein